MNVQSGEDVLADLRQLEQVFSTGVDCDIDSVCLALGKNTKKQAGGFRTSSLSLMPLLF